MRLDSPPSDVIHHNLCTHNLAVLAKHGVQLLVSEVFSEILHVDICVALIVAEISEAVLATDKLANITVEGGGSEWKHTHTLSRTHTVTHCHTHPPTHPHPHTHTHMRAHTHTPAHTHTHTHTHTHRMSHFPMHKDVTWKRHSYPMTTLPIPKAVISIGSRCQGLSVTKLDVCVSA